MRPEDVAAFLQEHPEFFEAYADTLAEISIPHPHGGRAISISERQILALREKNRQLETKLREIIQFGEENDAIGEKIQRLSVALLGARDLPGMLTATYLSLREDFAVPHVELRMWDADAAGDLREFAEVGPEAREFAAGLTQPHCAGRVPDGVLALFGEAAAHLRSFSCVPLGNAPCFGLLALASEDPQRFYPEMGTLYLKRIGELIGAALGRVK